MSAVYLVLRLAFNIRHTYMKIHIIEKSEIDIYAQILDL